MALVCFHGDNPHVINQERADLVLGVISDLDNRKIIGVIKDEFKTAKEISQEIDLPITTIYRKLRLLDKKNVLISSSKIELGKREFTYKSKIQKVSILFEDNTLDVKIYTNLRD